MKWEEIRVEWFWKYVMLFTLFLSSSYKILRWYEWFCFLDLYEIYIWYFKN